MNRIFSTIAILFLLPCLARSDAPPIDVPEIAVATAAAVDRFAATLKAGDFEAAGAELAPDVIIPESSGAEHAAAGYLAGHAKDDAAFLKAAQNILARRKAGADGDIAWVASESELHVQRDGKQ